MPSSCWRSWSTSSGWAEWWAHSELQPTGRATRCRCPTSAAATRSSTPRPTSSWQRRPSRSCRRTRRGTSSSGAGKTGGAPDTTPQWRRTTCPLTTPSATLRLGSAHGRGRHRPPRLRPRHVECISTVGGATTGALRHLSPDGGGSHTLDAHGHVLRGGRLCLEL